MVSDCFQVLLGHLEQDAAEVVRHEVGDRGQEGAERVDQLLGALGLVQTGMAQGLAHVLVEHLDRVARDRPSGLVVPTRERQQLREGEADLEEPESRAEHLGVALRVAGAAIPLLGDDQSLAATASSTAAGTPTWRARSSRVRRGRRHAAPRRRRRRGGVGGVEPAVDDAADDREREPAPLQVLDAGEPLHVLGAVPGHPAFPAGNGEQPTLLVKADGVDRHVTAAGELLDPDLVRLPGARAGRSHELEF